MTERTVVRSYSTQFERDEDPLSEDGMWIQGQTDGIDGIDVMTKDGRVFGKVSRMQIEVLVPDGDVEPQIVERAAREDVVRAAVHVDEP